MNTFIQDDFLLNNETAYELYHEYAKNLPIIDYHNHLVPDDILNDKNYQNLTEIWLSGDHYKWRAMRANGIDEYYITGDASDYEKFLAWAKTVPQTLGNPLYHWTHLELKRYFDIDQLLSEETAKDIWEEANAKLQSPKWSVRQLLKKDRVEFVGTTDDPVDSLSSHQALQGIEGLQVSPSFRPDTGLNIQQDGFMDWLKKLEDAVGYSINDYSQFIKALQERVDFFDELGCRSSDHGINEMFFAEATEQEVENIFKKRLNNEKLSDHEVEQYKTYTLIQLGKMYHEKGWIMQLHMGPKRNNNSRMFEQLGPDSGFDSINDTKLAKPLGSLMDSLERKQKLPKTVLYSLNPNDYPILASMAGNFQGDGIRGKIQFGTAWWFNDTIDGMENQMKTLANIGLISNFVGMLTDSRSFLSFSRHEYFRRILCRLFGSWVEQGLVPNDRQLLKQYIQNICYYNAKEYFSL